MFEFDKGAGLGKSSFLSKSWLGVGEFQWKTKHALNVLVENSGALLV